jgi:hypothetical protein
MRKILIASVAFILFTNTVVANNFYKINTNKIEPVFVDEIKVKLQNKGKEKIEIFYQKKSGTKDLTGATINQSSTITITVEAGSQIYYKVKGSKGPLLLTITADLNGTTQIIKQ